jgi:hypothetical protein
MYTTMTCPARLLCPAALPPCCPFARRLQAGLQAHGQLRMDPDSPVSLARRRVSDPAQLCSSTIHDRRR